MAVSLAADPRLKSSAMSTSSLQRARTDKRKTKDAAWKPQGKAQMAALAATMVKEVLLEGDRGGGKTITLIMAFVSQVGRGWGANWRGVIFRQTHPALKDIIKQSKQWIPQVQPGANFTHNDSTWTFPNGEQLTFSHFATPDDYWNWHGQELPFIGWEELTAWANDECYLSMMSCSRSSGPRDMPRIVRGTTNPYGPGRLWVKERWLLPDMRGQIRTNLTDENGEHLPDRLAINFSLSANKILLENDPHYRSSIRASAGTNEAMRKAWLEGDWEISVGGMFDDLWDRSQHEVEPFDLPAGWRLERAFDWGYSKPFSIGIYAISDGTPYHDSKGRTHTTVNGDVYRVAELYGWNGKPNHGLQLTAGEIAERLVELETYWGIFGYVQPGPADLNIFSRERGPMQHEEFVSREVPFIKATKEPGSRKRGWQLIRERLNNALPKWVIVSNQETNGTVLTDKERHQYLVRCERDAEIPSRMSPLPREEPGLFFFKGRNPQLMRTFLGAPRDPKDPDDIDTDYEDHALDELRYEISTKKVVTVQGHY